MLKFLQFAYPQPAATSTHPPSLHTGRRARAAVGGTWAGGVEADGRLRPQR